ncbi:MAG: putative zinc-binding peptidase [Devosia sp.]|uniref:zinc-binding metallopeptidase family protein n=1 Tax=Devosia sp. TaxID=1871048 RepID=UPI001A3A95FC|nr:putative zinc-binding metallopeptidase [Devosia sp.]MBL8597275.1 putative zinc-binding peptidase [Devosia sp.]
MKLFRCDHCSNIVYFENTVCESCGHTLGYWHETNMMVSLEVDGDHFTAPRLPGRRFVYCTNAQHGACNWLVDYQPGGDPYCRACRHNALVPDIADPANLVRWQVIERAKKRLFYSLLRFRLPLATRNEDGVHGLGFQFLNEAITPSPVLTGHASGIITLALSEADDAAREYRRTQFNEPYRTLLGHFRHEIGHHFWDLLVAGQPAHAKFRALFGDDSADYAAALQAYYDQGAPPGWQATHISAYATSHPWEDWAETWAHYLHIVDTTEMAAAFGVRLDPRVDVAGELKTRIDFDPYRLAAIGELIEHWIPLSSLINNLNRAVGQHDAYPFVLTPAAIGKLEFVQRIVRQAGQTQWTVPGPSGPEPINRPWQPR